MRNSLEVFKDISYEAREVFSLIQKNGFQTKNNLSLLTNIKLSTLNRIMQPLEEKRLVVQSSVGESTGGRKPVLYGVGTDRYYIAGVDISRTYTQVVITNLNMDILARQQFIMDGSCTPEKTVDLIAQAIDRILKELRIKGEMLAGAGLGTVGPLNREKGIMINPANFEATGWINAPIGKMLEYRLKCPVAVDNGANAAVLAESLFGRGKGLHNVVYFNCGIGVRTGVISSGTIIRSINNSEDAFGHMVIDVDGEPCRCGNYGCIECYSSVHSITERFISELKKGRESKVEKNIESINFIDICRAAEEKDQLAGEVITGAAVILGTGLANFINLLSPEMVILSGPLVKHSKLFYDVCRDVAGKKCRLRGEGKVVFSRGGYFEESEIAVGAAAMFVESCLSSKIIA